MLGHEIQRRLKSKSRLEKRIGEGVGREGIGVGSMETARERRGGERGV